MYHFRDVFCGPGIMVSLGNVKDFQVSKKSINKLCSIFFKADTFFISAFYGFIEVKTRRNYKYGRPEEAVTPYKQEQIRKIAQAFLTKNHIEDTKCRFDVLALRYESNKKCKIEHFIDAF